MTQFVLKSAGKTDVGLKRSQNEDSMLVSDLHSFWLVADGMGGHENGALASQTAVSGFEALQLPDDLDEAISALAGRMHEVNARLAKMIQAGGGGQMGTTAIGLIVREDRFAVIWVGDSRAYIYRRGGLFQLSVDHTHVQDLVDEGVISQAEGLNHPMGHVLTRALGAQDEVQVDVVQDMIEPGDRFILCSDGLTGPVNDDQIRNLVSNGTPAEAAETLVRAAHDGGAPDNVTVIVVAVEDI